MIYLQSDSYSPSFNLALEQYVFDHLPKTERYFMLWQNQKAVIIGKHQNTHGEINAEYIHKQQVQVVRRLSGGGAVYHDLGNLNFTFIQDAGETTELDMQTFCLPVVQALATLGVTAEISGRNDMTIDGRKFSGNAQYLKEGRVMHHGTIMVDSDLSAVAAALNVNPDKLVSKGVKSVRSRVTNVGEHLPEPVAMADFIEVIRRHVARDAAQYHLTAADLAEIRKIEAGRYATWEWNYGRSPSFNTLRERRIPDVGKVQLFLDVRHARIQELTLHGDFFALGEPQDLAQKLTGRRLEADDLHEALAGLSVAHYINGLSNEHFVDLILGIA